jgi:flagellar basal body-associated protein FliL
MQKKTALTIIVALVVVILALVVVGGIGYFNLKKAAKTASSSPGSPPSEDSSLLITANVYNVNDKILEKSGGDDYYIKEMVCRATLSENETQSAPVIIRRSHGVYQFVTRLLTSKPPSIYKVATQVVFVVPGYKDIVFKDVYIFNNQIHCPDVDIAPLKK